MCKQLAAPCACLPVGKAGLPQGTGCNCYSCPGASFVVSRSSSRVSAQKANTVRQQLSSLDGHSCCRIAILLPQLLI